MAKRTHIKGIPTGREMSAIRDVGAYLVAISNALQVCHGNLTAVYDELEDVRQKMPEGLYLDARRGLVSVDGVKHAYRLERRGHEKIQAVSRLDKVQKACRASIAAINELEGVSPVEEEPDDLPPF